jgi:hypothetical protein
MIKRQAVCPCIEKTIIRIPGLRVFRWYQISGERINVLVSPDNILVNGLIFFIGICHDDQQGVQ